MLETRTSMWPAARPVLGTALVLFVITIVIGILNGIDVYEPDHDTLITHVHAGTLGWLTLATSGVALLMFGSRFEVSDAQLQRGRVMGLTMIGAIALYVAAFWVGDSIPGDRIQRPFAGGLVFLVVIWFLAWMWGQMRRERPATVPRLALFLAWVSLLGGAVLGIILGIFSSQGEVPGLSAETASRLADAHPPAMIIGFLILGSMAISEWLLRPGTSTLEDRWGLTQVWLVFVAGVIVNVGFIADSDALLGPANLMEIIGVVIFVRRMWPALRPAGWRGAGTGVFARLSIAFLVVNLGVLTILVVLITSGEMDIDNLTEAQEGLVLTLDHFMFIGVMTNALFGVVTSGLIGRTLRPVDRAVAWGMNVGVFGFALGLVTVSPVLKRTFTPVLGAALLVGIAVYVGQLLGREAPERISVSREP